MKFEPKLITEGSEPIKYEQLRARMEAMDDTKALGKLPEFLFFFSSVFGIIDFFYLQKYS